MPLHPSLVHLPLGLAVLMPFLAAGFGWAVWTGRVRLRAWAAVVALQAALVVGGLVALQSGKAEEERVESVVTDAAIETHEEAAELFLWAAGLTLVVAAGAFVGKAPVTRAAIGLSGVMMVGVLAAGIRVGHAGGQLVYAHNAASAYQTKTAATPGGAAAESDDDERGPDGPRARQRER